MTDVPEMNIQRNQAHEEHPAVVDAWVEAVATVPSASYMPQGKSNLSSVDDTTLKRCGDRFA